MERRLLLAITVSITLALGAAYFLGGVRPVSHGSNLSYVELPDGFEIEVYASGFGGSSVSYPGPNPGPRLLRFHGGVLFVSIPNQGRIVAIQDQDGDSSPDSYVNVATGLNRPHGFDFHNGRIYIANTDSVVSFEMDGVKAVNRTRKTLVDGIPTGGHWTRTLQVRNRSLFISAGSSCNVCHEQNRWRAAITQCRVDGSNCTTYASGLRNAVGFVFHDGKMFATENGRDNLGKDVPPDEINIVKRGNDYGWPECYGRNVLDTDFHPEDHQHIRAHCTEPFETPSAANIQAHSAPLGLAFSPDSFPEYGNDLFVAYHGSWNRQPPTGYKVVRLEYNGTLGEVHDFATGWLDGSVVHGRPVDIAFGNGEMFVSDDNSGRIYRIWHGD